MGHLERGLAFYEGCNGTEASKVRFSEEVLRKNERNERSAPPAPLQADDATHPKHPLNPADVAAPGPDQDLTAAAAWLDRHAAEIHAKRHVPLPEAERLAWLEIKARLDGSALIGPRLTAWGTVAWSDPDAPPLKHFGEAR
jgi:hypothetical protein